MKIGQILRENQPKEHNQIREHKKKKKPKREDNLSFEDVMKLMKHDSYYRGKGGALRQK